MDFLLFQKYTILYFDSNFLKNRLKIWVNYFLLKNMKQL